MNLDPLASSSAVMMHLTDPGEVQTEKNQERKVRTVRCHSAHPVLTDEVGAHRQATEAQRLLLVQEDRVVCVVEHHRHDSALSVARLLCRLLLSEAFVYACPADEAELLRPNQHVGQVPDTWRELYRATPWADSSTDGSHPLSIVGIR